MEVQVVPSFRLAGTCNSYSELEWTDSGLNVQLAKDDHKGKEA